MFRDGRGAWGSFSGVHETTSRAAESSLVEGTLRLSGDSGNARVVAVGKGGSAMGVARGGR